MKLLKTRKGFESETVKGLIARETLTGYKLDPDRLRNLAVALLPNRFDYNEGEGITPIRIKEKHREAGSLVKRLIAMPSRSSRSRETTTEDLIMNYILITGGAVYATAILGAISAYYTGDLLLRIADPSLFDMSQQMIVPKSGIALDIIDQIKTGARWLGFIVGACALPVLYASFKLARFICKPLYIAKLDRIFVKHEKQVEEGIIRSIESIKHKDEKWLEETTEVKHKLLDACMSMETKNAVEIFETLLRDCCSKIRLRAIDSLKNIGKPLTPSLEGRINRSVGKLDDNLYTLLLVNGREEAERVLEIEQLKKKKARLLEGIHDMEQTIAKNLSLLAKTERSLAELATA